ncbi:MAG: FAD binding domain-containing protein [Hyphomonadaceae bacterium]|nr:FAD binding domain-containing protein [Hyphomonadaceae bacterium]
MGLYLRPTALADALAALADPKLAHSPARIDRLTVLAGGTDFYPAQAARAAWLEATPRNVIDISGITELKGIREDASGLTFGALTTWSDIADAALPHAFDGLKLAAREVGGQQVQNRGTIAGNLCNASPAADGVPPLLTLDAVVNIASARGRRSVPLAAFITGNRQTVLAADELVTSIHVPAPAPGARATFLKLGARAYLVISIVAVAAVVTVGADGCIARAAIAVGACSAVPQRLAHLERDLAGLASADAVEVVAARHMAALAPIDDVRGSAAYRRQAALVVTRRALMQCLAVAAEAAA